METYYQHPAEVWNRVKCERAAKHLARDGLGTPYPGKGYCPGLRRGNIRYNGGTIIDGELYSGEEFQLPILAEGFVWDHPPTWCWRIQKVVK